MSMGKCCIADQQCLAAANHSGAYTSRKCFSCGDYVCLNCSTVRQYYDYGTVTLCRDCNESYERDERSKTDDSQHVRGLKTTIRNLNAELRETRSHLIQAQLEVIQLRVQLISASLKVATAETNAAITATKQAVRGLETTINHFDKKVAT